MAVGNERTHPKFGGQGHCGTVVRFSRRYVGMLLLRSNLTEKAKAPGFRAAVTVFASQHEALSGQSQGILPPAGEQVRLAEMHD